MSRFFLVFLVPWFSFWDSREFLRTLRLLLSFYSFERKVLVFQWNLSDSKSPQVTRTLPSILADLNNAIIWTVSTRPLISKFSRLFINPSVTVLSKLITAGITVTFMFHSLFVCFLLLLFFFFSSLAKSRYLSLFSLSFSFTLWSAGTVLISCWLSLGLVVWLRLGDPFVSQNPIEVCASQPPGRILGCKYTNFFYVCMYVFEFFSVSWRSFTGVCKALDCGTVASEFKFQ